MDAASAGSSRGSSRVGVTGWVEGERRGRLLAAERISDGLAGDGAHGRVRSAGADDVGSAVGAWDGVDASLLGTGDALSDGSGTSVGGAGVAAKRLASARKWSVRRRLTSTEAKGWS